MHYPKIEFLRRVKGYTQKYMSNELGIDQAEYQRIESGQKNKIDDVVLGTIATLLGTTKEDLVNNQPYVFYINNADNSSQNNAPFGNQQFHNENKEAFNNLQSIIEQLIVITNNNQKLVEANLNLTNKILNS